MSTLEYLDAEGSVKNFAWVPYQKLHDWLSRINGETNIEGNELPVGVNRGKLLEELQVRRKRKDDAIVEGALRMMNRDRGYGKDWREYESPNKGYTHLEELLIYQPANWRKQAREYLFRYECNLVRESENIELRTIEKEVKGHKIEICMKTAILAVLFSPDMSRPARYEPLNFLLAYGVGDPLPALGLPELEHAALLEDLSPLDFFLHFQKSVSTYKLPMLRKIGYAAKFPRLGLIKEFDFADIIGQRLAKQMVRKAVVSHIWNQTADDQAMCSNRHPLTMIFAGPSGNGKTELAHWLAKLLNKPETDHFIKVDCGKLKDDVEVFGSAGAYRGSYQGSALNNFVLRMSQEPEALGIVLLDEIEKAKSNVIHALYQVIDKGEWTNKKLSSSGEGDQTNVIPCHNLIFIMTTNACDSTIMQFANDHPKIYEAPAEDLEDYGCDLAFKIRGLLQHTSPFTEAFMGRIGRIIPFLPMSNAADGHNLLQAESMTVAKLLIERQQEKMMERTTTEVQQVMSATMKHRIAKIIVRQMIPEAGVRSIQSGVTENMGERVLHNLLLERGGIEEGSRVRYFAHEEDRAIDFRVEDLNEVDGGGSDEWEKCDPDMYG